APYQAGKEEPRFDDKRGPRCYDMKDLPKPFPSEPPDGAFQDGTKHQTAPKTDGDGLNPAKFKADAAGGNGSGGGLAYSPAAQRCGCPTTTSASPASASGRSRTSRSSTSARPRSSSRSTPGGRCPPG